MLLAILATRDIVSNVHGIPMFVPHIGHAIRTFGDQCRERGDKNNVLGQHPEDFELVELGTYNDVTAQFELLDVPKQIATGANYRDQ